MARASFRVVGFVGMLVALPLVGREVGAETCAPEKDAPRVVVQASASGGVNQDTADILLAGGFFPAVRARVPDVDWVNPAAVAAVYRLELLQESLGGSADVSRLLDRLGSPFILEIGFGRIASDRRIVTAALFDTSTGATLLRQQVQSDGDEVALLQAVVALAQTFDPATLRCELLGLRERPAVPRLTLRATPPEAPPGEVVRVRATLTDESTGLAQEGKQVRITQKHGTETRSSLLSTTNQDGVVNVDLDVGSEPGTGSVEATWTGSKGKVTRSNPASVPYRVWEPAGDLVIRAPEAALNVGGAATVTATLQDDGTPVAGASVTFATSDGTVGVPAATTDAEGNAVTPFQAPDDNAVVDVTATTPAPPGKRPRAGGDLTATLSFVVDAGVTLSLNAPGTVEGGTSSVTADLVLGGRALPAIDVNFSLEGAGALSAASAPTNAAGRAEILWVAPSGNTSATITAEAVVDGLRYRRTVAVNAGAAGGTMTVKVLPGDLDLEILTYALTGAPEPAEERCISTLVETSNCSGAPADYGTQPAEVPVTVRADGAGHWIALNVTRPEPNVAVVDVSGVNSGAGQAIATNALLELTFSGAGTLDVVVEDVVAGPSGSYVLRRPDTGTRFTATGGSPTTVIREPDTSASTQISQGGPHEFTVYASSGATVHGPFSGTRRFTLRFRPQ